MFLVVRKSCSIFIPKFGTIIIYKKIKIFAISFSSLTNLPIFSSSIIFSADFILLRKRVFLIVQNFQLFTSIRLRLWQLFLLVFLIKLTRFFACYVLCFSGVFFIKNFFPNLVVSTMALVSSFVINLG